MAIRAKDGTCLGTMVAMALPFFREAERQCPRTGPGQKPTIPDWLIAALIMIVVVKKKKTKNAQYRYLLEHRAEIARWLKAEEFPSRSTYYERYRRAYRLYQEASASNGTIRENAPGDGFCAQRTPAIRRRGKANALPSRPRN